MALTKEDVSLLCELSKMSSQEISSYLGNLKEQDRITPGSYANLDRVAFTACVTLSPESSGLEKSLIEVGRRIFRIIVRDSYLHRPTGFTMYEIALRLVRLIRSLEGEETPNVVSVFCGSGAYEETIKRILREEFGMEPRFFLVDRDPGSFQKLKPVEDVQIYPSVEALVEGNPTVQFEGKCILLMIWPPYVDDDEDPDDVKVVKDLDPQGIVAVVSSPASGSPQLREGNFCVSSDDEDDEDNDDNNGVDEEVVRRRGSNLDGWFHDILMCKKLVCKKRK